MIHLADKPTVSIARVDTPVLEDGVGSVTLTCNSQANPPARVSWHKMSSLVGMRWRSRLIEGSMLVKCWVLTVELHQL